MRQIETLDGTVAAPTTAATTAPTAATVSACTESAAALKNTIDTIEAKDTADYQTALTQWNTQLTAVNNKFAADATQWASVCGDSSTACEPITSFFTAYPGLVFNGNDLSNGYSNGIDEPTCARKCRSRTDCYMYAANSNGECWLKGAPGMDTNMLSGFKSSSGMTVIDNQVVSGQDYWEGQIQ